MQKIHRRALFGGAAALAGAAMLPRSAGAQAAYPQRPVRLIVPYAPGGGTDVFSRLLAARIEKEFGQTLVIDNRGGGASVIGTQAVASAAPDGYTIGMMDSAFFTNPGLLGDKLPYDTRKDFITVSLLARTQLVLCVHPSSPFKTAQEFIAHLKANPGKLTFASAGIGTGIHLAGEQFRQATKTDFVVVPYRGGAPALQDFLAAKVDFTFGAVPTIKPHIDGGKARGLGVTRGRAPQLPGIPGLDEVGYSSIDSASELGLIVP
jgi:tripartite-type tricarboxylate transporter receptor subunit TctC